MTYPTKALYTLEEVRRIVSDMKTELLHPEFGSLWMPPDGELYVAYEENRMLRNRVKELENE